MLKQTSVSSFFRQFIFQYIYIERERERVSESREMPSKKGRDVFYATGFVVSRPLLKLDVIKNVRATVFNLNCYL